VKLLLAFLLIVMIGAVWETGRDRRQGALPLLALCTLVAVTFFGVSRFI
jgi:hypothetical protein